MQNISIQMRKGILEYIVLWIIDSWEVYGALIIEKLKSWDLIVAEWTIYPLLSRLQKDWLIDYKWVESDLGHPRKYYNLTQDGKDALWVMEKNWLDIKSSVEKILNK